METRIVVRRLNPFNIVDVDKRILCAVMNQKPLGKLLSGSTAVLQASQH